MNIDFITTEFKALLRSYKVPKNGSPSPRPWTFKHAPVVGAIEAHEIQAANGKYVGMVYSLADAKSICEDRN